MFLPNKLQIGCQPMYGVGDLKWLVALFDAGITPGIQWTESTNSHSLTHEDFKKYFDNTDHMIISGTPQELRNDKFIEFVTTFKPTNIEVIISLTAPPESQIISERDIDTMKELKIKCNTKFHSKNYGNKTKDIFDKAVDVWDGVNIKTSKAAGVASDMSVQEAISYAEKNMPNKKILISGGIGEKKDVDEAFDHGADALLAGTIFAVCEESPVNHQTKEKMIEKQTEQLKRFGKNDQQGIQLGETLIENDNNNMGENLLAGLRDSNKGIIFSGHGIRSIKKIMPIKDIVNILTQ